MKLKVKPLNIMKLKKITDISFKNNNISFLPQELFKLNKLEFLNLSKNNIVEIPNEITKLKKLLVLSIYNNQNINLSNISKMNHLKLLHVDKDIVLNNIELIKKLQFQKVKIKDAENNDLSEFIDSITEGKEFEVSELESISSSNEKVEDLVELTFKNYDLISDYDKETFCIATNFNLYDNELVKRLCYEKNENFSIGLLFNKTIPIRFIMLIYILNFKDWNFKEKYIFTAIKEINNKDLNYFINMVEKVSGLEIGKYMRNNFAQMNDEILFAYAMSNIESVYKIRELISELTNNLEILDELSKNKNDNQVIGNIIFKSMKNDIFTEIIKGKDTIYSLKTLNRISQYEQYYEYENKLCRIAQVASNYSLSNDTRDYLFNKYNDDKIILNELNNHHCHLKLKRKIENILGKNN